MDLITLLKQLERTQWERKNWPPLKGPIITRFDLQKMNPPKGDFVARTSGSTGVPVEVQKLHLANLWWSATNLREAIWHKRDFRESYAVIRAQVQQEICYPSWGALYDQFGKTGKLYAHPVSGDLNSWLQKIKPGYLFTYPSILETIDVKALPSLRGIKTTGETFIKKEEMVTDIYSCEEAGTIAIQCPDNPNFYHVMENIIVEILDEENKPAESGKIVITDLTSLYLHRYEIGDYGEFGTCTCNRGLQTLKSIKGRRRNMVLLPNGKREWPLIGSPEYRKIAPIQRYQVAQVSRTKLEFRLIIAAHLTALQEEMLTKKIQSSIGYPFEVEFVYVECFPAGKFEEFINAITEEDTALLAHTN